MSFKIVAFGASNSRHSINKKLARWAANQIKEAEINLLDLNDYEMPMFSVDREREQGIPELAYQFKAQLKAADGIIISFAEHNGAYTVAFKNVFDWISRIKEDIWYNKPMFLLATSPGRRGGRTVLDIALNKFKFMNQNTLIGFSLPSFKENFSDEQGITNEDFKLNFGQQLQLFEQALIKQNTTP